MSNIRDRATKTNFIILVLVLSIYGMQCVNREFNHSKFLSHYWLRLSISNESETSNNIITSL